MNADELRKLYLDLVKRSVLGLIHEDDALATFPEDGPPSFAPAPFNRELREHGRDWPSAACSMIGLHRMNHLQSSIECVLRDGIPGDLIETGVWRGGTTIFMRAVLKAHGVRDRLVWVADSFQGFPADAAARSPDDAVLEPTRFNDVLAVPLEEVQKNFARYGLLDEQVRFLPGWFHKSLPDAPIRRLAVLRLDCDLYTSTTEVLDCLYRKLSDGGFVIVDDYMIPACARAVSEFRERHSVREALHRIDYTGVYWRKGL